MARYIISLFVALMIPLGSFAQGGMASRYNMMYLNMASGTPSNFIDDIFQDSYGFVWLSTHTGGLVRYDGYSYMSFSLSANGSHFRSNSCRNVYEDHFERLWVAFEEGIQVLSLRAMQPIVPNCATEQLASRFAQLQKEHCIRVYCDVKGNIWMIMPSKIYRLAFNKEGVLDSILSLPCVSYVPDLGIKDIFRRGTVVIGNQGKVYEVMAKGNKLVTKDLTSMFPPLHGRFVSDLIYYNEKIWLATNAGLYNNGKGRNEYHHSSVDESLQHDLASCLAISPGGKLLIGTLCGVDILDDKTGEIEHWNSNSVANPLSGNFVNCIYSNDGQIWIGTETGGVTKLMPRQLNLINYVHIPGDETSMSQNVVNSMYVEPDGTLWVGVTEGGLNRLPPHSNHFSHITTANSNLSHNTVSVLAPDGHGNLWVGTWGGGVNIINLKNPSQVTRLVVDEMHQPLLTFMGALVYDAINDGMWLGSNEGLYFYNLKRHVLEDPFKGCHEIRGSIGSLITKKQKLLMGCLQGMVEVNLKSRPTGSGYFRVKRHYTKFDNPSSGVIERIHAFYQSRDGKIWLGSYGYGLYCASPNKNGEYSVQSYTVADGLANNSVTGIVEDSRGILWITTEHGLSLFNPKTKRFNNFYKDDGLVSSQFGYNGATCSRQGIVYLGTANGLVAVIGENGTVNNQGHLRFTHLQVDNQSIFADGDHIDEDIAFAKRINLHESAKSFTIEFSALNYGTETQGVYSYRMKGFEKEWIQLPPGQHSVRYSTLPAGNYKFMVKYSPSVGSGIEKTASIDIHVTPYFWKSWWFVTLLIIGVGILMRMAYVKRLEQVRKREVEAFYRPIELALKDSVEPDKLQARIQEILENQHRYQESQKKTLEADKKEVKENVRPFMEILMEIMESNYSNSNFGVQELADALGMTRNALNKKLSTETGLHTTQFIRNYRLDISRKMIVENVANRNVAEIAYRVGFNDPKYFTRCFTKQFGGSPTTFKENLEEA